MKLSTFSRAFAALIVCMFSAASSAESGIDMKLMNATFPFQVCIHKETDRELEKISTKGHKTPTDVQSEEMIVLQLDGIIWGKVLENCKKHFGDSEKGLF